MATKYDIYAIGNALVDIEFEVSDAFLAAQGIEKGMMTLVEAERQQATIEALLGSRSARKLACGGSAANTVMTARFLGSSGYYSCRVADDAHGELFVQEMRQAGLDTNMIGARPPGVTGTCLVMVTPDGERTMNTFLGISEQVSVADLDETAVAQSRYVYLEGYLVTSPSGREAARRLRDLARAAGARVALTFSDPAMATYFGEGLRDLIGDGIDLLFCNRQEACAFTGQDQVLDALEQLKPLARQVLVTVSEEGALGWDGQTLHRIPVQPVVPVDTNGAGDTFAGAFLHALTNGVDFAAAGRLACQAAARVISDFGPRLSRDQLVALRQDLLGDR